MASPYAAPPPFQPPQITYIGDIGVTATHVITPNGTFPIAGTQWWIQDATMPVEKVSQLGIILAVVGFFFLCFFSLFFLLMKETQLGGFVQVTVSGSGFQHTTAIPALAPANVQHVNALVNWARAVAATPTAG